MAVVQRPACMIMMGKKLDPSVWPSSKLRSPAWLWTQRGQNTKYFRHKRFYKIPPGPGNVNEYLVIHTWAPYPPRRAPREAHFKQARPPRLPLQPAAGRQSLAWFLFVLLCCCFRCFVLLFCLNRNQQTETKRYKLLDDNDMLDEFDLLYSMSGFAG